MRVSDTTWDKLTNIINTFCILGCFIVLGMSIFLATVFLLNSAFAGIMISSPVVYGVTAIGWLLVLLGLGKLGLGWKLESLEMLVSQHGAAKCTNCGCISSIPILLGLLIGFLYHAYPIGIPLLSFYPLPLFATICMMLIGISFIIYRQKLKSSDYVVYISTLYISVGAGTSALYFSGIVSMSEGLIAWLLLASGPIFMVPLILVFIMERKAIPQQP